MSKRKAEDSKDSKETKVLDLTDPPAKRQRMSVWDEQESLEIIDFGSDTRDRKMSDFTVTCSDDVTLYFHRVFLQGPVFEAALTSEGKERTEITVPEDSYIMNLLLNMMYRKPSLVSKLFAKMSFKTWDEAFDLSKVIYKYDCPSLQAELVKYVLTFGLPWPLTDMIKWLESIKYKDLYLSLSRAWFIRVSTRIHNNQWDTNYTGENPGALFWNAAKSTLDTFGIDAAAHIYETLPNLEDHKDNSEFVDKIVNCLPGNSKVDIAISKAPVTNSMISFLKKCAFAITKNRHQRFPW